MTASSATKRGAKAASLLSAVDSCAELLAQVLKFDAPADHVMAAYFRDRRQFGARDRALLGDTVYAVLRQRGVLEHLARNGPGSPTRRLVLLGWAGDRDGLRLRLPEDERRWLEAVERVDRASLPPELRHNLPPWLADALRRQVGDAAFDALADRLNSPAPLDLRVNTMRRRREDVQAELARQGVESIATPYSPWGLRVHGKPALGKVDVVVRGDVEVQDEGSQLLALLLDPKRGHLVVDFCAGGGGKTLAIGSAMRSSGRLYAFDTSASRLDALRVRCERAGLTDVYTMQIAHDERDERVRRLAGKADRVLVDAPCSGTGTLRRHPDLRWRVSPGQIPGYADAQHAILRAAAELVKPGGLLVYATCSLLVEENEAVADDFEAQCRPFRREMDGGAIAKFCKANSSFPFDAGILRTWPHLHGTDGFFAVAWRRL